MNKDIIEVVNDFNQTILSLSQNIACVCPNSIVGNNIKDIEKAVKNKENFTKFIDIFCVKVLKYKNEIDEGKDSFFMDKDYRDDLKDNSTNDDAISSQLDIVISIKSIWSQLKRDNKDIVIQNMQILCELAQIYFSHIYNNMKNN